MAKRHSILENARRPWMLGTNDIPPPIRVPWQIWSKSSDPHEQGLIQFEFTEEGLGVGWYPDGYLDKNVIPWHELAWMAGSEHPDLATERQWIKEESQAEGYRLGLERAVTELTRKIHELERLVMYISCKSLWDAGITKDKVGCCGSCHDDAEIFPGQYDLIEVYPEDIGLPRGGGLVGSICCAVSHFLNYLENKREVLLRVWETDDEHIL